MLTHIGIPGPICIGHMLTRIGIPGPIYIGHMFTHIGIPGPTYIYCVYWSYRYSLSNIYLPCILGTL